VRVEKAGNQKERFLSLPQFPELFNRHAGYLSVVIPVIMLAHDAPQTGTWT